MDKIKNYKYYRKPSMSSFFYYKYNKNLYRSSTNIRGLLRIKPCIKYTGLIIDNYYFICRFLSDIYDFFIADNIHKTIRFKMSQTKIEKKIVKKIKLSDYL